MTHCDRDHRRKIGQSMVSVLIVSILLPKLSQIDYHWGSFFFDMCCGGLSRPWVGTGVNDRAVTMTAMRGRKYAIFRWWILGCADKKRVFEFCLEYFNFSCSLYACYATHWCHQKSSHYFNSAAVSSSPEARSGRPKPQQKILKCSNLRWFGVHRIEWVHPEERPCAR